MGFLETLGRSQAITTPLKAISDIETGIESRAIAKEDLGIRKAQEMRKQTVFEREQTRRGQQLNIKLHPMFQAFSPEGQERITKDLFTRGIIDEEGIGNQGNLEDYVKEIETTSTLFESIMKPEVMARERKALNLIDELREEQGKDSPNPKKIQLLQMNIKQATGAAAITRGNYKKAWDILKARELEISKIPATKTVPISETMQREMRINPTTGEYDIPIGKPRPIFKPTEAKLKSAQNYILPDGDIVLSYDGGRTYTDKSGVIKMIPSTSIKVPPAATLSELEAQKARQKAGKDITGDIVSEQEVSAKQAALGGTGPYASLAAAIDSFFGGFGADKIFGKNGFFSDTQENRQQLRTIKQMGKAALMNSSRGAVWEQEKIDKLFPDPDKIFTNPRTEARKFKILRDTLEKEKRFNNQAIASGASAKEIEKIRNSTFEIDRLLALIGGEETTILSTEDEALINKYEVK